MIADDLDVFVHSIDNYFKVSCDSPARVGTPFLTTNASEHMADYTGCITISGNYRGAVFFSAPERMLMRILRELGLVSTQHSKLMDLVGEISNILSGNARKEFGEDFNIMPPKNFHGSGSNAPHTNVKKIFVIPIEWHELTANLIVNLETDDTLMAA